MPISNAMLQKLLEEPLSHAVDLRIAIDYITLAYYSDPQIILIYLLLIQLSTDCLQLILKNICLPAQPRLISLSIRIGILVEIRVRFSYFHRNESQL